MLLEWRQNKADLTLRWLGPNLISTAAVTSMADVMAKIAVISGPKGDKGTPGVPGAPGLPGDGSETFIWSPPSASVSWIIPHNLSKFPSITIIDSTGRVIYGEVTYLDNNLVEIAFAFPVSGTAYLN